MRKRQSQGSVERYGVTLSSAEPDEHQVIETLQRLPRGRRQQWIRKLLLLGVENKGAFVPRQDRLPWVGSGSESKKVLSLALDRGISEEALVLEEIEKMPFIRRGSAIRAFLSVGIFFEQKKIRPFFQQGVNVISADTEADSSAGRQKVSTTRLKAPEKREKVVQKSSKPKVTPSLTINIGDNPPVGVSLDAPLAEQMIDSRGSVENKSVEAVPGAMKAEEVTSLATSVTVQAMEKPRGDAVVSSNPSNLSRMRKLFDN